MTKEVVKQLCVTKWYVYVYVYMCICVCMYVCMHACMYVCVYACVLTFPKMSSTDGSGAGDRRKDKRCGGGPTSMRHHCGFLFCASAPMSFAWHVKSEKYLAAKRMRLHKKETFIAVGRECQMPENIKGLEARH